MNMNKHFDINIINMKRALDIRKHSIMIYGMKQHN